ncbi:MAG TPA: AAA family ATPase [Armatimonadota bacterium]|nr:AAA family ATPase [Armatimonadota bacterium]
MSRLINLKLAGWKSIPLLENLEFGPLNVLIGANGAGKSNLISFFKLLNWMTLSADQFPLYVGRIGGANALLHDGAARTPQLEATITLETGQGINDYHIRLFHAAGDTFVFAEEEYRFSRKGSIPNPDWTSLGAGHRQARLIDAAEGDKTARAILSMLRGCKVFQFHNTSETARLRQYWDINDAQNLREDAANLAPFLLRLRDSKPEYYRMIVETIRQAAPFFADFVLEPLAQSVILQWTEKGSDIIFGAHQASDGTLRLMALVALLLQPPDEMPDTIILDEPELGLHPFAVNIVAGLLRSAAVRKQVIIATQSVSLIDRFDLEQVIVVDRPGRASTYTRLNAEILSSWLEEYTLSELWEKNVIGGGPIR